MSPRIIKVEYVKPIVDQVMLDTPDLTIAELARRIGISKASLYNIRNMQGRGVQLRVLARIASFLKCRIFFSGEKPVLIPIDIEDLPEQILTKEQFLAIIDSLPKNDNRRRLIRSFMEALAAEHVDEEAEGRS
jgi:DNA-binding Xre family transcriptional regulator